jgi:hypothetical protein
MFAQVIKCHILFVLIKRLKSIESMKYFVIHPHVRDRVRVLSVILRCVRLCKFHFILNISYFISIHYHFNELNLFIFFLEISWIIEVWTTCNRKCGGGKQTREVYCVQDVVNGTRVKVPDNSCPKQKPAVERSCNMQECPQWFEGPWSEVCSLQPIDQQFY